jgi:hypothetical protein
MVLILDVTCPTCRAGMDRRCGDADGEFDSEVYHPERIYLASVTTY